MDLPNPVRLSRRNKSDLAPILARRPDAHNSRVGLLIPGLDGLESLQDPEYGVTALRVYHDVRGTDARTPAKGNEVPHRTRRLPPFGAELLGVRPPEVRVPVHEESVAVHDVALCDEYGLLAVGASSRWESGVFDAVTHCLQTYRV